MSAAQISHVEGMERRTNLPTLNLCEYFSAPQGLRAYLCLDHNRLNQFTPSAEMRSLRALRVSHNLLATLSRLPRLRSFSTDRNRIQTLWRSNKSSVARLEYVSLRDQDVRHLSLSHDDLRDVKRLYISGEDTIGPLRLVLICITRKSSYYRLLPNPSALLSGVPRGCCLLHARMASKFCVTRSPSPDLERQLQFPGRSFWAGRYTRPQEVDDGRLSSRRGAVVQCHAKRTEHRDLGGDRPQVRRFRHFRLPD